MIPVPKKSPKNTIKGNKAIIRLLLEGVMFLVLFSGIKGEGYVSVKLLFTKVLLTITYKKNKLL